MVLNRVLVGVAIGTTRALGVLHRRLDAESPSRDEVPDAMNTLSGRTGSLVRRAPRFVGAPGRAMEDEPDGAE
jgi:hypothetical protein